MSARLKASGIDVMHELNTVLSGLAELAVLSSAFRLVFNIKPVIS